MIEFLNPAALSALIAAGLPILLHLLKKEKTRRVQFSAVRFLKELEQKRIKHVRLYQYLIILLRTLFIIFLVLTFARPSVSDSPLSGFGSSASTTVVVVDDSYSMQSFHTISTSFDKAKNAAGEILESFDDTENVFMLGMAETQIYRGNDAKRRLADWQAGNEKATINDALTTADSIFNYYKNPVNRLFIISDFTFPVADTLPANIANARFAVNTGSEEPLNLAIDSAYIVNRLVERDKPMQLEVLIANKGNNEMESALALRDSSKTYALDYVKSNPGTIQKSTLSFSVKRYGPMFLTLELDEDDLSVDNSYYIYRDVPASLPVLAIADSLPLEMQQALNILNEKTVLDITVRGSRLWQARGLSDYKAVLLWGPEKLVQEDLNRIRDHVLRSNGLIILPGQRTTGADISRLAQSFGLNVPGVDKKVAGERAFFGLQSDKRTNNFYKELFRNQEGTIETPVFKSYFEFSSGLQPLIRFNNGDIFLGHFRNNSNIHLFSADLSTANSNTLLSGLFLPLLYRVIYSSGYSSGNTLQAVSGQHVRINPVGLSPNEEYMMVPPSGGKETLIPEQHGSGFGFNVGVLQEPGFYKIVSGEDKLVFVVTVNSAAGEINGNVLDNEYFADFQVINPDINQNGRQKYGTVAATALWPVFLILALLMLLLEMWLIYKLEGKQKPAYE